MKAFVDDARKIKVQALEKKVQYLQKFTYFNTLLHAAIPGAIDDVLTNKSNQSLIALEKQESIARIVAESSSSKNKLLAMQHVRHNRVIYRSILPK